MVTIINTILIIYIMISGGIVTDQSTMTFTPPEVLMKDNLTEFLTVWEEEVPILYEIHVCDCSDMSMYMVKCLNAMDYDAYYMECHNVECGETSADRANINHAIVGVNVSGEMVYVEATWGQVILHTDDIIVYNQFNDTEDYLRMHNNKTQDIDNMRIIHDTLNGCD